MKSLRVPVSVGSTVLFACLLAWSGCDGGADEDDASGGASDDDDDDATGDDDDDAVGDDDDDDDASAGSSSAGETGTSPGTSPLGQGVMRGAGTSTNRYAKADVFRDGKSYYFMANGWGEGFESHTMSWNGTSFTVDQMAGSEGPNWQPASYPTVFCGVYSDSASRECGLPAARSSISSLRTGWRWSPNGNNGEYNAAYDVWMGTGTTRDSFSGYFMVWLREPPGQQPAGAVRERGVTVANVPGVWDIWTGSVNSAPIVNYVRAEGNDTTELEFDVLDFMRDAEERGHTIPGSHILSVAVGFEIWNGPVTNLESIDFYVDVQ